MLAGDLRPLADQTSAPPAMGANCQRCQRMSAGARRSISVTISGTEHKAAALPLCHSPSSFSPSQHKPCPRFPPTLSPPLPTFNRSSMPPWTRMRRRQKPSFSHIPLPPSYSPATRPPPFYPFCKTSSSNLIAVAEAMRG